MPKNNIIGYKQSWHDALVHRNYKGIIHRDGTGKGGKWVIFDKEKE